MNAISKLYKKENYTIQKSINIEDGLYTRLKEIIDKEFDATISEIVNACVEDLITNGDVKYYAKPEGEIVIYRSIMIRKDNVEGLNRINRETGISVTRLINIAIRNFLENFEKN